MAAVHPAQILSYNKMLGQLQDAGNTTTLAHYLRLLESAFLISGLEVFKAGRLVKRGGSPKLIIWNNGLINALIGHDYRKVREDFSWWGRLVENAVGAHLINHLRDLSYQIYYCRQKGMEVDFVVKSPQNIYAVEVKSGKSQRLLEMEKFQREYPTMKPIVIGPGHIEFEAFFSQNPAELFI